MIVDDIFENKVGFGRAQIVPLVFLSLVDLNDGAQLVLSSFLTPVIQQQWHLSQNQISTLTAIFYFGIFFGSIISGYLADKFGRKPLILMGSVMQIVVSLMFFWVDGYEWMIIARGLYGFSYGFSIAVTTSAFAEISPPKVRGKGILFLNFCVSIGKLYGLLLAIFFLDSFTSGNWRAMIICGSIPNIFVLYASLFILKESPRFLIATNQLEQAYKMIEDMIQTNNPENPAPNLTAQQKQGIKEYYQDKFEGQQKASIKTLFNSYYLKTTLCFSLAWFSINFIYFGQLVVLPFIFGKAQKTFTSYAITILGEIPSFLISLILVDRPNFGRKNSLKYFFSASALMHFLFILQPITAFSSICRLFMKMCFQMLYPATTESYGTLNRTLGFGFNSAVGRLGATIMPYIVLPLIETSIPMISVVFTFFALLGAFASWCLPHETMGRVLDQRTQTELSQMGENRQQFLNT